MSTVRFSLPPDKLDKEGKGAVDMIYQLHAQRKFLRTSIKLFPINWDQKEQEAVYIDKKGAKLAAPGLDYDLMLTARQAAEINGLLDEYRNRVRDIEKRFELDKETYSAQMVIDKMREVKNSKTKTEKPSKYVYDFIDRYIQENETTRVKGSLMVYKSLKRHLQKFEKETKTRVAFDSIDHNFFKRFQNYLLTDGGIRNKTGLCNTTVSKQLSTLRTFLSFAKSDGIVVSDRYKLFKIKKEEGPVIALTQEEFNSLLNLDLKPGSPQDHVRNAFCFACTTGLRYSDLKQLNWENVKEDEIVINVIKKKKLVPHVIPLTPYSRAIIKKYKGQPRPLHVISNQRMNDHLKGHDKRKLKSICKLAGITELTQVVRYRGAVTEEEVVPKYELIGVHTGRKTFVTLSLEFGMTAEEVMPISGHENYASFKRYVNITDQRKKKAMAKAWGE